MSHTQKNIETPEPVFYKSISNPTGPKVVLTCLSHGDEVIGLNSALQLLTFAKENDANFFGEMVVFPCLNEAGFWANSRYFVAQNLDGNVVPNLNRVWPGNNNSFVGLVAKKIFDQILSFQPDLVLDLHSYAQKSLIHIIVDRPSGNIENQLITLSKKAQIPFYLEYPAETLEEQMLDKSLSNQLCLHNIPALTVELGPKGSFGVSEAKNATNALINMLIASGNFKNLAKGDLKSELKTDLFTTQNCQIDPEKLYFRQGIYAGEQSFGFYRLMPEIGNFIEKDQEIVQIYDLCGNMVESIEMPENGYIIAMEDEAIVYPKRQIGVFIKVI